MPANLKEYIAAGFDRAFYMLTDSAGYVSGYAGTVSSGAAGQAAGRMKGVKTSDLNIVEPETVTITGDDGVQGIFIFAPNQLPSFGIEAGVRNLSDEARYQSTLVQDIGNISVGILQPNDPVYRDVALLFTRRNKSKAAASDGVGGYEHLIIPRANIVPLGNFPLTERAEATGRYRVSASVSDQLFATGNTMNNTSNGTTGGVIMTVTSDYLMTWHAFLGDGATLVFGPLDFTPASSSLSDVLVYVDGLRRTTGITIDTSAKTLTFSVAPTSGSKISVFYGYTQ